MKKIKNLLYCCMIFCIILSLAACNSEEKYRPSTYTKEEVIRLYAENRELFKSLVKIISSSETFYEEGRINEYTDADIISPYDDALSYFNDIDQKTIDLFFELKPYMILYDYARRFVKITFLASDTNESYTLLFWTSNAENREEKFDDYKETLDRRYILESIDSWCVMYY